MMLPTRGVCFSLRCWGAEVRTQVGGVGEGWQHRHRHTNPCFFPTLMLAQFWGASVIMIRNITASPEAFATVPTTAPPGIPPDTLEPGAVSQPPYNISGFMAFHADAGSKRPLCNFSYSKEALFRAVPLPPNSPFSIKYPNLTTDPITLVAGRMTYVGLASAPVDTSEGAVSSALPLWPLSLAPGERNASRRCEGTGWVVLCWLGVEWLYLVRMDGASSAGLWSKRRFFAQDQGCQLSHDARKAACLPTIRRTSHTDHA